jgi:hypothetical protein
MHQGRMVFSQVMDYFPVRDFQSIVARYEGDKWVQSFTCRSHFNAMAFAQFTGRASLRDIATCLATNARHLHHMGIQSSVSRNNLAHANETRDWRIYRDVAMLLINRARQLCAGEEIDVDLKNAIYAFDSTTVELCLTLFPWANFRRTKAGIKMHTSVDVRGNIPSFIRITDAKQHDVNALDDLPLEPGAYYLVDRGYLDFRRLHTVHAAGAFFVTRTKRNTRFRRQYSRPVDKASGLRSDHTGVLCGVKAPDQYPDPLRRVTFRDPETGKRLCFLTNSMSITALDVCRLYKLRWQVELFFKWIKQHLRIKHFVGTSLNAVHVQIWVAIATYTLVAIMVKELSIRKSMYDVLQFLNVSIFEKALITEVFSDTVALSEPESAFIQQEFL